MRTKLGDQQYLRQSGIKQHRSGSPESSIPERLPIIVSLYGRVCLDTLSEREKTYVREARTETQLLVAVALLCSNKNCSDRRVETQRAFSASKCPKRSRVKSIHRYQPDTCVISCLSSWCRPSLRSRLLSQDGILTAAGFPHAHPADTFPTNAWGSLLSAQERPPCHVLT